MRSKNTAKASGANPDLTFPSYLADEENIEEGFARDEWGNEDGFDCDSDE